MSIPPKPQPTPEFIPNTAAGQEARKVEALEYIANQLGLIRAHQNRIANAIDQINRKTK